MKRVPMPLFVSYLWDVGSAIVDRGSYALLHGL